MNKLKRLRLNQNLTQDALAKHLNIGQSAISKWERGKTLPDISTLKKLSEFYKVPIEELLQTGSSDDLFVRSKANQPLTALQRKCLNYILNLNDACLEKADAYLNALYNISK